VRRMQILDFFKVTTKSAGWFATESWIHDQEAWRPVMSGVIPVFIIEETRI